jgi:hypothetical protein
MKGIHFIINGKVDTCGENQKKSLQEKNRLKERKNKKNTKQEEVDKCRRMTVAVYWSQIFLWMYVGF